MKNKESKINIIYNKYIYGFFFFSICDRSFCVLPTKWLFLFIHYVVAYSCVYL